MNYLRRLQLARMMNLAPDGGGTGTGTGTGTGDGTGTGTGEGAGGGTKTFDDILKDKEYQAEFDRRVAKALETTKTKLEAEMKEKLEAEKTEAARLAKMNADERAREELKKEQEKFNSQKTSFERERMELETTKMLASEKLPVEFAKMLMADTAENTKANVEAFKKAFGESIEAAVTERLKGNPPKAGDGAAGDASPKDAIKAALYGTK